MPVLLRSATQSSYPNDFYSANHSKAISTYLDEARENVIAGREGITSGLLTELRDSAPAPYSEFTKAAIRQDEVI